MKESETKSNTYDEEGGHSVEGVTFEEMAASIVVATAAIYLLGLVALCWPIYTKITKDGSAILYAVSVVPKTMIAGHGVRFLVGLPLIWSLLFVAFLSVSQLTYEDSSINFSSIIPGMPFEEIIDKTISALYQEIPAIISIAIVLFFLGLHEVARAAGLYDVFYSDVTYTSNASTYTNSKALLIPKFALPSFISSLGGAIGAGIILVAGINGKSTLVALMIFLGANIVANIVAVLSIDPPLPKINITTNGTPKIYTLLAHSEGCWYIFDDLHRTLRAIPDDKAEEVEIIWKP